MSSVRNTVSHAFDAVFRRASVSSQDWPRPRRRAAVIALLASLVTVLVAISAGGSVTATGIYILLTAIALIRPATLTLQLVAGEVIAADLLLAEPRAGTLIVSLLIGGVIITADLIGVVARLGAGFDRDPTADLRRTALLTPVTIGVFAAVLIATRLPGPTGPAAIAIASAACGLLAFLLTRRSDSRP